MQVWTLDRIWAHISTDAVATLHHRFIIVDKIKDLAGATIAQPQAMLGLSSGRT